MNRLCKIFLAIIIVLNLALGVIIYKYIDTEKQLQDLNTKYKDLTPHYITLIVGVYIIVNIIKWNI